MITQTPGRRIGHQRSGPVVRRRSSIVRTGCAALLVSLVSLVAASCGRGERVVAGREAAFEPSDGTIPSSDAPGATAGVAGSDPVAPPPTTAAPEASTESTEPAEPAEPVVSSEPVEPVAVDLADVLVTADDLGAPWTAMPLDLDALPAEEAPATTLPEDESYGDCLDDVKGYIRQVPATAEAIGAFELSSFGPWFTVLASRSSTAVDLQAVLDAALACDAETSWQGGTYTVTRHPFPELGDRSVALHVVLDGSGTWNDGSTVTAMVQVGDVVISAVYVDLMADELLAVGVLEDAMRLMVERLAVA
ncbi:MAG: hypothetical protein F2534_14495 [Actinobacteria bacterium]|uniref:Unannotated protein n=1 Tax=freshwater metagenome TaxID=449393 RepID=A0A6J6EN12_9ZZZZ|nr:hypothetical protein [Actinomycetota bacterium]